MASRILAGVFCALLFAGTAYADSADSVSALPIRCGTIDALRLANHYGKVTTRPDLSLSVHSAAGHFRVHYNATGSDAPSATDIDLNGIPDYVDSTLIFLEDAWTVEVTTLGFQRPRGDGTGGGGSEIDVYLQDLASQQIYGVTYTTNDSSGTASGYIIVDNNFTDSIYKSTSGYAALKVTTAHEFFHVVQFGYSTNSSYDWWMEQTATWMEDQVWPDVNDYLAYMRSFFTNAKTYPLDYFNGSFEYGAVLWPTYLAKRYGSGIVRAAWEKTKTSTYSNMSSFLNTLITSYDTSANLPSALNEFGGWNFFTGSRAPSGEFYTDGSKISYSMSIDTTLTASAALASLSTVYLTSNYVELILDGFESNGDSAVTISAIPSTTSRKHASSLIRYNSTTDYAITPFSDSITVSLEKAWTRTLVVTTCTNSSSTTGYCSVRVKAAVDTSAQNPGTITVTSPNGGETWTIGTTQTVTWTSTDVTKVTVAYSTNNGSSWTSILSGISASSGSCSWVIPNKPSTTCLVRVSDTNDASVKDVSDAVFTIQEEPSYIVVTSPNGGESWTAGTTQNITWTSSGVTNVTIAYSTNGGSTWTTIQTNVSPSSGTYAWTVPNKPSTTCLVRVSDTDNATTNDVSNTAFTIVGNGLPTEFHVYDAHPNPFSATTTIEIDLPEACAVRVRVYNVLGQQVTDLGTETIAAGTQDVTWTPEYLTNGVYFVRITTTFGSYTAKTLFVKTK